MKRIICFSLLAFTGNLMNGQPTVYDRGIVNAASLAKIALPNSSIAQGSFFSVFGTNMGPSQSPSLSFPLQTTLGGVSITIAAGGQNFSAIPLFVGPGQINAVLPSKVPVGPATLTVSYNGTSNTINFQVVAHSFGIFTVPQSGAGPGIIDDANYHLYNLTSAALPGDIAIIWGTGLAPVLSGDETTGPLPGDRQDVPAEVYVGLKKAELTYRGRSGCCVGVDQIFFKVPAGITGCHVPVAVKIGNIISNFATMPIAAATPRVCSDGDVTAADLTKYQQQGSFSVGSVDLSRSTTESPGLPPPFGTGEPTITKLDFGSSAFVKFDFTKLEAAQNPFQITTLGTCYIFGFAGQSASQVDSVTPTPLDAGKPLLVKGPNGSKELTEIKIGTYGAQLGGGSGASAQPLFLDPGAYTVTGPGGKDVGPFTATLNIAEPLTWTNKDSITTVVRSAGQNITWSGGDPNSTVTISGSSIQQGTAEDGSDTVGGFFTCSAPDSAKQFFIPAVVLDSLPASTQNPDIPIPFGSLSVSSNQLATFTASGIDRGFLFSIVTSSKSVNYQ